MSECRNHYAEVLCDGFLETLTPPFDIYVVKNDLSFGYHAAKVFQCSTLRDILYAIGGTLDESWSLEFTDRYMVKPYWANWAKGTRI